MESALALMLRICSSRSSRASSPNPGMAASASDETLETKRSFQCVLRMSVSNKFFFNNSKHTILLEKEQFHPL